MGECKHTFAFQHVVYEHDEWPLPGSGARSRYYYDRYYCTLCLHIEDRNRRTVGNSYHAPIAGTVPRG